MPEIIYPYREQGLQKNHLLAVKKSVTQAEVAQYSAGNGRRLLDICLNRTGSIIKLAAVYLYLHQGCRVVAEEIVFSVDDFIAGVV